MKAGRRAAVPSRASPSKVLTGHFRSAPVSTFTDIFCGGIGPADRRTGAADPRSESALTGTLAHRLLPCQPCPCPLRRRPGERQGLTVSDITGTVRFR